MPGTAKTIGRHRAPRRRRAPWGPIAAVAVLLALLTAGAALLPGGTRQSTAYTDPAGGAADSNPGQPLPGAVSNLTPTAQPTVNATAPTPAPTMAPTTTAPRTTAPTPRQSSAVRTSRVQRSTPASTPPTTVSAAADATAVQVLEIVNRERAANGCAAVTLNGKLTTASQRHSEDQAAHNTMSHTGSDGSTPWQRAERVGYDHTIGENVAAGYQTAQAVMVGWMNSAGHRDNILNCEAKAMGLGVATADDGTRYWTQMFGSVT